jgi:intracellular sulfur oxidation DsrE/DsrF family protein
MRTIRRVATGRRHPGVALLLWLAASGLQAAETSDAPSAQSLDGPKAVYHADFADPRRFSAMLTSVRNMVETYRADLADYDVRIVFVAHGIRFVTDDKLAKTPFAEDAVFKTRRRELRERLITLQDVYGVTLELCDITRKQVRLPEAKLMPGVALVPSGVVRLAELQRQGFAYIKVE